MKARPIVKDTCSKLNETTCAAMEEFASDQYGSGRRIFITQTHNMETDTTGVGVAYQWTGKRKDFVWINFCPWCGGKWFIPVDPTQPNQTLTEQNEESGK